LRNHLNKVELADQLWPVLKANIEHAPRVATSAPSRSRPPFGGRPNWPTSPAATSPCDQPADWVVDSGPPAVGPSTSHGQPGRHRTETMALVASLRHRSSACSARPQSPPRLRPTEEEEAAVGARSAITLAHPLQQKQAHDGA
jgi:hypothetical protein